MLVLGLDTTLNACSAALVRIEDHNSTLIEGVFEWRPRGHAEALAPMVKSLLEKSAHDFTAIDRIAVTLGPGTFTGVRIGLAAARGFGLAADRPVIGLTTFEAIAQNHWQIDGAAGPLAVLVDARRGEVYCQIFSNPGEPMSEPAIGPLDRVLEPLAGMRYTAIGSAAEHAVDLAAASSGAAVVSPALAVPDAAHFAHLAAAMPVPTTPPNPLYLRRADAKQQKRSAVLPAL